MKRKVVIALLMVLTVNVSACNKVISETTNTEEVVTEMDAEFNVSYEIPSGIRESRPQDFYPDETANGIASISEVPTVLVSDVKIPVGAKLSEYLESGFPLEESTLTLWNAEGVPDSIDKEQLKSKPAQSSVLEVTTLFEDCAVSAQFAPTEETVDMNDMQLCGFYVNGSGISIQDLETATPRGMMEIFGITEFVDNNTIIYSSEDNSFVSYTVEWDNVEPYNIQSVSYVGNDAKFELHKDIH